MEPVSKAEMRRRKTRAFRNRWSGTLPARLLRFLPWWLQLLLTAAVAAALLVGLVLLLADAVGRQRYDRQRIARIDESLVTANPAASSAYCKAVFGWGPRYAACWAGERHAYGQFAGAWRQGKDLSTVRDHLIACFAEAQEQQGTSWQTAATCAELDIEDRRSSAALP